MGHDLSRISAGVTYKETRLHRFARCSIGGYDPTVLGTFTSIMTQVINLDNGHQKSYQDEYYPSGMAAWYLVTADHKTRLSLSFYQLHKKLNKNRSNQFQHTPLTES